MDLLLNQESRPIPIQALPRSNDLRSSACPPRLLRCTRVPLGVAAALAIATLFSIAGVAHASLEQAAIGTGAPRGAEGGVESRHASTPARESEARVVVVPLISAQYQASRRNSRGSGGSGSGIAATHHGVIGPALSAGVGAATRPLVDTSVDHQKRLAAGKPAELRGQGRRAHTEAALAATHRRAQCYRQYYAMGNSQYQFATAIITTRSNKCAQISVSTSREGTPMASSSPRSTALRIPSQTDGIAAASTVRSVGSSPAFFARQPRLRPQPLRTASEQVAARRLPIPGVAGVISPQVGAVAIVSRPSSTAASRALRLGLVFALVYLVFLVSWFWGTRGLRRRAGELRLERGLE